MSMKEPNVNEDTVNAIGVWTLRIVLVIGAIALSCFGKDAAAGTCGGLCALSFFLL